MPTAQDAVLHHAAHHERQRHRQVQGDLQQPPQAGVRHRRRRAAELLQLCPELLALLEVVDGKHRHDINADRMKEYAARAQKVMEERAVARKVAQAA